MKPSLFRSLIELTTDAVFIVRVLPGGEQFVMEYVNDAYLHKFNVTRESVVGREFRDMLHTQIVDTIRKRFIECVRLRSNLSFEESFENGTTSLSELFPIMDADSVIEYVVGISKDITELKMKRDQITASEQTLQSIINSSDNLLIYMSNDFTIRYANRRAQEHARKLFGKSFSIGDKLTDYYPKAERELALKHALQLKEQKQTISHEHQLVYPDGETRWFLRRYYGVFDEKGELTGIVIASINITNRKEQELQIQKQADSLREIAKIQSHEIRRPVANIIGLVDLIDLNGKTLEENEQILQYLRQSAQELDGLISRIVDKTQYDTDF
ncbi:MAG: PAS domain-containing protein [Sediminibacterium sp. Gen4]|uniref:PAS domain-containing protein n=1 Tax=unclassified Sediminibacterium TaxID=2635961 RepID=UPI0015BC3739|nr:MULTISPECIES: PAS domain-containing protein [unclassified Sediminibacterium]MBW0162632.1 PAS domain-containing protein [Sediminibacterium sp.]MBW0163267.1 PAS domain-containing protein [Sediminibacterium sp.]NWK66164.1 PAS domain-containing protein [Sediminibacterium sp. Gen4]